MPSVSKPQHNLMAACAHGAGYSSCPPAKVSREFNQADKGLSFANGGLVMAKGYMGKDAEYAGGGPALGRTKDFMKTEDRFRSQQYKPAPKTDDNFGKDGGDASCAPPAKGKELPAVKPRG